MKKIIVFLLLFMICIGAFSQTWEFYDESPNYNERISHALEYESGSLMSVASQAHPINKGSDTVHVKSVIRIHDLISGEVVRKVMYEIDTLSAHFGWIFHNPETGNFIIAGYALDIKPRDNRGYFLVTIWDEDLSFISDTIVRLEPYHEFNRFFYMTGNFRQENEFLVVGYYSDDYATLFGNSKIFICRIEPDGRISLIKWYKNRGKNSSIFFDSLRNRYVMFGLTTLFLDQDFNKIDSLNPWLSKYPYGLSMNFDDEKYLVSADFNGDNGIALIDPDNLTLIKGAKIPEEGNNNHPFFIQNFDFIDTSQIFFGAFSMWVEYFGVNKVNSNMEPYWLKYFSKDDDVQHVVWSVVATSDGGCVMTGGKGSYNLITGKTIESAWALKLDADGNTVSTKDHSPTRWEITVYPNPSSGDFRIEIAGEVHSAVLMLFDMQGRQVRHYNQLSEGSHTFDFSGLPTGAYVWKLLRNGEVLGDGKWIKGR